MRSMLRLYLRLRCAAEALVADEGGQDLIEYALVVALICLAATVSMKGVATAIGQAYTRLGTRLSTYTS